MDERKRKRSVDMMAANCVAVRLRLVNRVITNLYDEALRPLGLKISQLNILVVAAKLGVAQPAKSAKSFNWTLRRSAATSRECGPGTGSKLFREMTCAHSHFGSRHRDSRCSTKPSRLGSKHRPKRSACSGATGPALGQTDQEPRGPRSCRLKSPEFRGIFCGHLVVYTTKKQPKKGRCHCGTRIALSPRDERSEPDSRRLRCLVSRGAHRLVIGRL